MKQIYSIRRLFSIPLLVFTVAAIFFAGCNDGSNDNPAPGGELADTTTKAGVVNISTQAMNFKAPDSIPPGWTTFNYQNESANTHFFVLEKYPEGKNLADMEKDVIPVFQSAMDSIMAGKTKAGFDEFGKLPEWFSQIVFRGGSGLVGPGDTSHSTINVEPGTYVVECYVKTPEGKFHSAQGMVTQIRVSGEDNQVAAPSADFDINISTTNGIELDKEPTPGQKTFAVHFIDQKPYENFVGHDVQLVRLKEGAEMTKLEHWMNWVNPDGLVSPVPEGFEFLGGSQEMPAGNTAYFTANPTRGKYALIAEIPEPSKKKMLKTFTVAEGTD